MKKSKGIIIVLIVALVISWLSFFSGTISTLTNYWSCIDEAEYSIENGLYEQAIEYYKKSLEYKVYESTYESIKSTYDMLYEEEHTAFIRGKYINDMETASQEYPQNALFWEIQANLQKEALNYSQAYSTVKKAQNFGASSQGLDDLYFELYYMANVDYKLYSNYKTALNGYISVYDGNDWVVLNEQGKEITGHYNYIGLLNDDGKGIYINNIDTRILDKKEITRARFDFSVEDAGYYNEKVDIVPVKIDGQWKYMKSNGDFIGGSYQFAGSFFNNAAVAYTGQKWLLVDVEGKETELSNYEDIKFDLYGSHNQNGIIIAKEAGKYGIYDENFSKKNEFTADDIDICVDGKTIAYKQGNLWGFASVDDGSILVEPQYKNAKSFSNGYAAVCDSNNQWGFINSEYTLCIDYSYIDAFYFNSNNTCLVSTTENTFQMLHFMFDE